MVALINKLTGGDMMVDEKRVDEYLAAGHSLAASPKPEKRAETPIMNEPEANDEKPVKKVTAKRRKG